MSIQGDVRELQELTKEINNLSSKLKGLKKTKKNVEERIAQYMKGQKAPGFKYQGSAIMIEKKERIILIFE